MFPSAIALAHKFYIYEVHTILKEGITCNERQLLITFTPRNDQADSSILPANRLKHVLCSA
jgi:hypothetical protein